MARIEGFATSDVREDRFTIWPIVLACSFPAVLILLWTGLTLAFVGAPILMIVWVSSAVLASVFAISAASARLWRRALSLSVLPLATLPAIASWNTVWPLAMETGERIHFHAMRRSYLEEVAKLPSTGEPRFVLWQWGGFGVGHGVVYDESDEIPLPERSSAWKKRVENTEAGACGVWGTPLGDHFYLVRTGC
jgi:hypothetical protein